MNLDATIVTEPLSQIESRPSVARRRAPMRIPIVSETERQLLAELKAGDESAFDQLVNQHHGALLRMAMGYVKDREVAEEVVQDTWMAVIESLHPFDAPSSLRT